MFWTAINAGDRVDSALKDMAVVMKQLDRSDEAIEAIKSFRHLCPSESQESLDNILLELYKVTPFFFVCGEYIVFGIWFCFQGNIILFSLVSVIIYATEIAVGMFNQK